MSGPYFPVNRTEEFAIRIALQDASSNIAFKANPTIAAGDFKVDIDGGGLNNLATLPSVSPAGGVAVKLTLSPAEMTGNIITIRGRDQTASKEWSDFTLCIVTQSGTSGGAATYYYLGF